MKQIWSVLQKSLFTSFIPGKSERTQTGRQMTEISSHRRRKKEEKSNISRVRDREKAHAAWVPP